MWPFKCILIEVKTFKCGCTCVLTGPVDIIAQLPTICLLQVHHDVAIYITFQSKLLLDSISEGQIFKIFLGGHAPKPPYSSTLCTARPIKT